MGLEIELGNLPVERVVDVVRDVMGGRLGHVTPTEGEVVDTQLGRFKVELDAPSLKARYYLRPLERLGFDADGETAHLVEDSVLRVARTVVPVEIVAPPIPWSRLGELDALWPALRAAGGEGTSSSLLHAFGLHLNPEPPDLEATTTRAVLRSFLLLEDWLFVTAQVDLARRIAPFIHPFPESYRRLVLAPGYAPDWDQLVDDYVEHNPTRNRPLDLLPLMVHLGADNLEERVENWPLVRGRPTYHYRLPNSDVCEPGWSPLPEWNRWVVVERLAEDAELLQQLCAAYLDTSDLPWRLQSMAWVAFVEDRIARLSSDLAL